MALMGKIKKVPTDIPVEKSGTIMTNLCKLELMHVPKMDETGVRKGKCSLMAIYTRCKSHRTTESNTLQGYTISAIDSERAY